MNISIFSIKTKKELEDFIKSGGNIHENDKSGYNFYLHAPIELYPCLLEEGLDVNSQGLFGNNYLFVIKDKDKLRFLINNGLNKNHRLKNGRSPYKNADLEFTLFFMENKIPYETDDFSNSIVVQEYLMDKGVISKKDIEITGKKLKELSNYDFKLFTKRKRDLLKSIIMMENMLKELSLTELNILKDEDLSIYEIASEEEIIKEFYNCDLERIKVIEEMGYIYSEIENNKEGFLNFENIDVMEYIVNKNNIRPEDLTSDTINELISAEKKIRNQPFSNFAFFSKNEEWLEKFAFPFEQINYFETHQKDFFNAILKKRIVTLEDTIKLLESPGLSNKLRINTFINLNKGQYEFVLKNSKDLNNFDLLKWADYEQVLKVVDNDFDVNWLEKNQKTGDFLLTQILSVNDFAKINIDRRNYKTNNFIKAMWPEILKNNSMDEVVEFVSSLNFLEDILFIIDEFKVYPSQSEIKKMLDKSIRNEKMRRIPSFKNANMNKNQNDSDQKSKRECLLEIEKRLINQNRKNDIHDVSKNKKRL